ncbi:MAG: TetR family transcriptional regulator [Gammaproteobacteria bacterium]|nr:TetR family transcriptional regulator [Gammaproteobacteria bacterium]|tara:strand:- start:838 stop:1449 length:612 start_codon:yes stop_codon:yes gene_type:complete
MSSYHHGNLKRELIKCAYNICEKQGFTKLSIRSLAKESNVSQSAPYRHFKTKEDLYAAVAEKGFENLHKSVSKKQSLKFTRNDLINAGKEYINFGLKHSNTYDLMFGTELGSFQKYPDLLESANKTFESLKDNVESISLNKDPEYIGEKCISMWAYIHGLVGILRKVDLITEEIDDINDPMNSSRKIGENIDGFLKKFIEDII